MHFEVSGLSCLLKNVKKMRTKSASLEYGIPVVSLGLETELAI